MDRPPRIVTDIYTALPRLRAISSMGSRVTLSDGKQYLDLMNGKGSVTLGHHHPAVNSAINCHLRSGLASATCWSDLHEALTDRIICDIGVSEAQLAFFSTGTEACRAAVQAARQFTGRHVIASAGYHGWGDYWATSEKFLEVNASGVVDFYFVPELLEEVLERYRGKTALVILSPDYVHLQPDTIRRLAHIAAHREVLICCDDVKQGYRSVRASKFAQTVGLHADLYTFAKGLANGHRLSCLVGRSDVMAAAKEFTYTAYFDTLPIIAALATLEYMDSHDGYQRLVECGAELAAAMRSIVQHKELPIQIYGNGPLLQIVGASEALDKALYANCASAGLLLYEGDNQAVSLATADVINEILDRFEEGLTVTSQRFGKGDPASISNQRRFQAAFRMIDGATDGVPVAEAIYQIKRWR